MLLAKVCKRWRHVACSTPLLWSSINIYASGKRSNVPLLAAWLERSRTCPLTIYFKEPEDHQADAGIPILPNPLTEAIMALLITQVHRWKAVQFLFALRVSPALVENLRPGSLQLLESAKLHSRENTPHWLLKNETLLPLDRIWDALHSSPFLRIAEWETDYLEHRLHSIPWMQLTTIDVMMSARQLLLVLPHCHNLIHLRFKERDDSPLRTLSPFSHNSNNPQSEQATVLPNLRALYIHAYNSPDPIFQRLILPSLEKADIHYLFREPKSMPLVDLLTRSRCCLKEFSYQASNLRGEDVLVEVITSSTIASITELTVDCDLSDNFFARLSQIDSNAILPNLGKLSLETCTTSPGILSNMVSSRTSTPQHIRLLRVLQIGHWARHNIDLERIRALALSKGIHCRV
ncbi:hypothetical protein DXG01_002571 [Tephrocybe rancida]|nr:hypothetical protein DXG01_002571 [Tephrocybe rancida]